MGVKKFKNLYKNSGSSQSKKAPSSTSKESLKMAEPARDRSTKTKEDKTNIADKAQIEQLRKVISKKMNDPAMAKKAAQIIEEMLKGEK